MKRAVVLVALITFGVGTGLAHADLPKQPKLRTTPKQAKAGDSFDIRGDNWIECDTGDEPGDPGANCDGLKVEVEFIQGSVLRTWNASADDLEGDFKIEDLVPQGADPGFAEIRGTAKVEGNPDYDFTTAISFVVLDEAGQAPATPTPTTSATSAPARTSGTTTATATPEATVNPGPTGDTSDLLSPRPFDAPTSTPSDDDGGGGTWIFALLGGLVAGGVGVAYWLRRQNQTPPQPPDAGAV